MECNDLKLSRYLDNELTEVERAEVEEHLKTCSTCRENLSEWQANDETFQSALKGVVSKDLATHLTERVKPLIPQPRTEGPVRTMMPKLIIRHPNGKEGECVLDDQTGICHIGRAGKNEIQILKGNVSRHHCQIQKTPQGYQLTDLKSTAGTYVNNIKVNQHLLSPNDQIKIGDSVITFVLPEQIPASPVVEKPEPEPPKRLRPRRRRRPVTRSSSPATSIAIAAGVLLALIVGAVLVSNLSRDRSKPTKPISSKKVSPVEQEAQAQLALARSKERLLADDHTAIKQLYSELLAKYKETGIAPTVRATIRHYDDLILKKSRARLKKSRLLLEKCEKDYYATADKIYEYLMNRNYLGTRTEWQKYLEKYSDSDRKEVQEWVQRAQEELNAVTRAMDNDFKNILAEVLQLFGQKEFAQARDFCQTNLTYFTGTPYESQLQEKLQEAEDSHQCYQMALKATALTRACRYTEALREYQTLLARLEKSRITTLKKEDYLAKFQDLQRTAPLFGKLIACINNKTLSARRFELADGRQAEIAQATNAALILSPATNLPWAEIESEQMVELYRRCRLTPEDRLALARYCLRNNLSQEASEVLGEFARKQPSRIQETYPLVARLRHMEVPGEGFVYHKDQWLTSEELKAATLVEEINGLVTKIGRTTSERGLAKTFSALEKVYHNPALPTTAREQAQRQLREIIAKKRAKVIKKISRARPQYAQLKELKEELNKRRAEALKVIYDTTIYCHDKKAKKTIGQDIVDEKVARVREIWDGEDVTLFLGKSAARKVEEAKRFNQYLTKLGIKPEEQSGDGLEKTIFSMIGKSLNIRNFTLNANETRLMEYNKKIWEYNTKLEKGEIPTSFNQLELEQTKLTNEYREMMGRKVMRAHEASGRAARKHSQAMQAAGRLWHTGPDGSSKERAAKEGYRSGWSGENCCAFAFRTPWSAFNAWYHSPPHHRNMLGSGHLVLGVGQFGPTWTQSFGSIDDVK